MDRSLIAGCVALWGLLFAMPVCADTIAETSSQGKSTVLRADCLVVVDEDPKDGYYARHVQVAYVASGRLITVDYFRTKEQPDYVITRSAGLDKTRLLAAFKAGGIAARITDTSGLVRNCYSLQASYGSPEGSVIVGATNFDEAAIRFVPEGATNAATLTFSSLARIRVDGLSKVTVEARGGATQAGRWRGPDLEGRERRIFIEAVCDDGTLLNLNARQIRLLEFDGVR